MKIKAVWKDEEVTFPNSDITLGKEYEVLRDHGDAFNIIDDAGDHIFVLLTGSAHGFDFEVVQEEADPMPVVEPDDFLEQPTDNVNNPSHYGNGQIECCLLYTSPSPRD